MLKGYDYSGLSPREFELLSRDLIQRKISDETGRHFVFNSFTEGKDEGVDAIYQDSKTSIILQAKRFAHFDNLYQQLKNIEIGKIRKLKATRYILCTSLSLSKREYSLLYDLLKPFLTSGNDIADAGMLNNLLGLYPEIAFDYPKLYLPSMQVLGGLLNAAVYGQSRDKLEEYKSIYNYYVQDDSFPESLSLLNKNKYLVISGEPGVGKSTLAGMLSLYFLEKDYEFIFIRTGISEASEPIWNSDKKQLFLFDDYLGSTAFKDFDRNEDRMLIDFVKKVQRSKDKLFILTTREYIFRQGALKHPELSIFEGAKYGITQQSFTPAFKIRILYNYLYYSDVELKDIDSLLDDRERYIDIIGHPNFTPRIISDYIAKYHQKENHSYSFYKGLYGYLNDPFEFWQKIFLKLSPGSQIVLLIMAVSGEPVLKEQLYQTYLNIGSYRKLYEKGFEKESFNEAIHELSDSFISISKNPDDEPEEHDDSISLKDYTLIFTKFRESSFIEFSNPSIKDFSLRLLSERPDLIEFIIRGAALFNQLFNEFTLKEPSRTGENNDDERRKIFIPYEVQGIFIQKFINEFDQLPVSRISKVSWKEGAPTFHLDDEQFDSNMLKLKLITEDVDIDLYKSVRTFVIDKYFKLVEEDRIYNNSTMQEKLNRARDEKMKTLSSLSFTDRMDQPVMIMRLKKFVGFDGKSTLAEYYKNIMFSKEFIAFHSLRSVFPSEWDEFFAENKNSIRKNIRATIYSDVDYFMSEGVYKTEQDLAWLIEYDIYQLSEIYNLRISDKFKRKINDMSGRNLFGLQGTESEYLMEEGFFEPKLNINPDLEEKKRKQYEEFHNYKTGLYAIKPEWYDFPGEDECYAYIRHSVGDQKLAGKLIRKIRRDTWDIYYRFMSSAESISLLLKHITYGKKHTNERSLLNAILNGFDLSADNIALVLHISHRLSTIELFEFRKSTLVRYIEDYLSEHQLELNSQELADTIIGKGLIIQHDRWCKFVTRSFHNYLTALYIKGLPLSQKKTIYEDFQKARNKACYDDMIEIWQYCIELDKAGISKYFLAPVISDEYQRIKKMNDPVISFLKEPGFSCEFFYWEEEKRFVLEDLYPEENSLIVDFCKKLDIDIYYPIREIGNIFNISENKSVKLRDYIKKYCMTDKMQYTLSFSEQLKHGEFILLLKEFRVDEIIDTYLHSMKSFLNAVQAE